MIASAFSVKISKPIDVSELTVSELTELISTNQLS